MLCCICYVLASFFFIWPQADLLKLKKRYLVDISSALGENETGSGDSAFLEWCAREVSGRSLRELAETLVSIVNDKIAVAVGIFGTSQLVFFHLEELAYRGRGQSLEEPTYRILVPC